MNYPQWLKDRMVFKRPKEERQAETPVLDHIVYPPSACEDCGRMCDKPRTTSARKNQTPISHWRWQCNICRLYWNPETGAYDLNSASLREFWLEQQSKQSKK